MFNRVEVTEDWKSYNEAVEKYAAKFNFKDEIKPNNKIEDIYTAREKFLNSSTLFKYILGGSIFLIALAVFIYILILGYKKFTKIDSVFDNDKIEIIQKFGELPQLRINPDDLNLLNKKEENYLRIHPDDLQKILSRPEPMPIFPNLPQTTNGSISNSASNDIKEKPVINYTIFNSVKWKNYTVVTGYKYNSNNDSVPNSQYCYLEIPSLNESESRTIHLANSGIGKLYPLSGTQGFASYELNDALNSCVWFNNKIPF